MGLSPESDAVILKHQMSGNYPEYTMTLFEVGVPSWVFYEALC